MTAMRQTSREAAHVHYVSLSAGLWLEYIKDSGGQSSASSQTDDPADWLTFARSNGRGRRQHTGPSRERRVDEVGGEILGRKGEKYKRKGI